MSYSVRIPSEHLCAFILIRARLSYLEASREAYDVSAYLERFTVASMDRHLKYSERFVIVNYFLDALRSEFAPVSFSFDIIFNKYLDFFRQTYLKYDNCGLLVLRALQDNRNIKILFSDSDPLDHVGFGPLAFYSSSACRGIIDGFTSWAETRCTRSPTSRSSFAREHSFFGAGLPLKMSPALGAEATPRSMSAHRSSSARHSSGMASVSPAPQSSAFVSVAAPGLPARALNFATPTAVRSSSHSAGVLASMGSPEAAASPISLRFDVPSSGGRSSAAGSGTLSGSLRPSVAAAAVTTSLVASAQSSYGSAGKLGLSGSLNVGSSAPSPVAALDFGAAVVSSASSGRQPPARSCWSFLFACSSTKPSEEQSVALVPKTGIFR